MTSIWHICLVITLAVIVMESQALRPLPPRDSKFQDLIDCFDLKG